MTLSYFDSSILLAILLDEKKQEEAYSYWQKSIRVSSLLLKIETVITLRRIFENNNSLGNEWLGKKTKILDEYLNEVYYETINVKIEKRINMQKELAQCRTLDAIHIATALQFREINNNEETCLYTFDKNMHNLANYYKFKTNKI